VRPLLVAVLSTGYTPGAAPPEDGPQILEPVNFIAGETGLDGNGHSTAVTNLIAALVPFKEAKVLPIKVLSDNGTGQEESILKGLELAAERGARLVVAPLGRSDTTSGVNAIYEAAIVNLEQHGALMLAAAGNDARRPDYVGTVNIPASLPLAVSVGATDPTGAPRSGQAPRPRPVERGDRREVKTVDVFHGREPCLPDAALNHLSFPLDQFEFG
jgi:subtilisin family serine protease